MHEVGDGVTPREETLEVRDGEIFMVKTIKVVHTVMEDFVMLTVDGVILREEILKAEVVKISRMVTLKGKIVVTHRKEILKAEVAITPRGKQSRRR
ncbi:hypothetical protein JCGZ_16798 [Jatropha curcas]|uniref:Uncharacterized protein n=1 Tax=Jatropha curcas TaxID=180498 RepID=A0A067L4V8_JATCU|nr:hypothetical protein JCGZ_16798 [Jatropha curcas]